MAVVEEGLIVTDGLVTVMVFPSFFSLSSQKKAHTPFSQHPRGYLIFFRVNFLSSHNEINDSVGLVFWECSEGMRWSRTGLSPSFISP